MDPGETLDIDGHISQHSIHHLDHFQSPSDSNTGGTAATNTSGGQQQQSNENDNHQQHHQQQQHQQPQQQQQQHQHHQQTIMEIDPSNIKHEQGMIITPEIVSMMTGGHMGECFVFKYLHQTRKPFAPI